MELVEDPVSDEEYEDLAEAGDTCDGCAAILDPVGRCWYCDRAWIWS